MEKWTSEKKDKLIVLWRKAEALYNKMDPNYSDYSYHQKLVKNIAYHVKMPCKLNTVDFHFYSHPFERALLL